MVSVSVVLNSFLVSCKLHTANFVEAVRLNFSFEINAGNQFINSIPIFRINVHSTHSTAAAAALRFVVIVESIDLLLLRL